LEDNFILKLFAKTWHIRKPALLYAYMWKNYQYTCTEELVMIINDSNFYAV